MLIETLAHTCTGWEASLSLGYAREGSRTILARRTHRGPLVVQKPLYPEGPESCHTILVHPPGGIAGGDRLAVSIDAGACSHALITTPGAAKWYKANGRSARQSVDLALAEGAALEWLPQEAIVFDGADAQMCMAVRLEPGAAFLGWELVCLGRSASGERFGTGRLHLSTEVRLGGRPLWREQGTLAGGSPLLTSPVGLAGCTVFATLICAGKTVDPNLLTRCREVTMPDERCGVTALPNLLLARYLGHSSERARCYFIALWTLLRPWFAGRPACIPRIWNT